MSSELFPKWIIENGRIIIGKVTRHEQLSEYTELTVEEKKAHIIGGGWFKLNNNEFLFYNFSSDFGQCTLADVQAAYQQGFVDSPYQEGRFADMKIKFSTCRDIKDAVLDNVELIK